MSYETETRKKRNIRIFITLLGFVLFTLLYFSVSAQRPTYTYGPGTYVYFDGQVITQSADSMSINFLDLDRSTLEYKEVIIQVFYNHNKTMIMEFRIYPESTYKYGQGTVERFQMKLQSEIGPIDLILKAKYVKIRSPVEGYLIVTYNSR